MLLRHPELVAEAEEITSTLLVVEDDQELADEITAKLRALRASGPVSARRHDGAVRPWKRRLSDDERSVLLHDGDEGREPLLRHPARARLHHP